MEPAAVVPVDPADLPFDVAAVPPGWPLELRASALNNPMVDSHKALSRASPTVPIGADNPGVEEFGGEGHGDLLPGSRSRCNTASLAGL